MAIKQIQLFDGVHAEHNLKRAEENYSNLVPLSWGPIELNEGQLKALDYLNHQKDRWEFIQAQEKALNDLIAEGYRVLACYPLGNGVVGCQMILYKPDPSPHEVHDGPSFMYLDTDLGFDA